MHKTHLWSAELAFASVVQQVEESSLFCRRVIWIELIRRPLAAASAGCHADVSSAEKGTVPQVALLREAVVCMCAFHVLLCVRRIPEMFAIDFKPMLSSVYFSDITSDIKINSPAPRMRASTPNQFLRCWNIWTCHSNDLLSAGNICTCHQPSHWPNAHLSVVMRHMIGRRCEGREVRSCI